MADRFLMFSAEALQAGARVYLVEKTQRLGGNSEKASSGINGAKTAAQAKLWLKDSVAEFYAYSLTEPLGWAVPMEGSKGDDSLWR